MLSLFLSNFLSSFASLVEYFRLEVILVADHVDLDILLASLSDEVYPLGYVLDGGHICIFEDLLAKSKTTNAMCASLR